MARPNRPQRARERFYQANLHQIYRHSNEEDRGLARALQPYNCWISLLSQRNRTDQELSDLNQTFNCEIFEGEWRESGLTALNRSDEGENTGLF